ncbi:MAG TPA: heme exporter protein CcmD [Alphaproteobacteria bacterium]
MADFSTWLAMGGYAAFVWPSYAITAALLIGLLVVSLWNLRRGEAELARNDRVARAGAPARRDRKGPRP